MPHPGQQHTHTEHLSRDRAAPLPSDNSGGKHGKPPQPPLSGVQCGCEQSGLQPFPPSPSSAEVIWPADRSQNKLPSVRNTPAWMFDGETETPESYRPKQHFQGLRGQWTSSPFCCHQHIPTRPSSTVPIWVLKMKHCSRLYLLPSRKKEKQLALTLKKQSLEHELIPFETKGDIYTSKLFFWAVTTDRC